MAANTFANPTPYARAAIGALSREIVLPRTVTRDYDVDFSAPMGTTVNVRVGALLSANENADVNGEHTNAISRSAITERSIAVVLDKLPYSAVPITTENQTLQVEDFGARVLRPQAQAVAEKIEGYIAAAISGATYETGYEIDLSEADPWGSIVDAGRLLNEANVPRGDRFIVCGPEAEAAILKDPDFKAADQTGTSEAFREAIIGRRAGFTVIGSNAIETDEAYAYHKSAFILATRAPVGPMGSVNTSSAEYGGIAATWAAQWNEALLQNESVVWSLAGTKAVYDANNATEMVRAVKLTIGS